MVIGHAVPVGRARADRVEHGVGVVHLPAVAGGRGAAGRAGLFGPFRLDLIAVEFRLWKPSAQARDLACTHEGVQNLRRPGPTATLDRHLMCLGCWSHGIQQELGEDRQQGVGVGGGMGSHGFSDPSNTWSMLHQFGGLVRSRPDGPARDDG